MTLVSLNTSPSSTLVALNTSPSSTLVALNTSPSSTLVNLNTSPSFVLLGSFAAIDNNWENETRTYTQVGLLGKDSD
tara:strand:- start:705 stop:935 length:231 start_codon:yes stop_codon:yes gene_type:complete